MRVFLSGHFIALTYSYLQILLMKNHIFKTLTYTFALSNQTFGSVWVVGATLLVTGASFGKLRIITKKKHSLQLKRILKYGYVLIIRQNFNKWWVLDKQKTCTVLYYLLIFLIHIVWYEINNIAKISVSNLNLFGVEVTIGIMLKVPSHVWDPRLQIGETGSVQSAVSVHSGIKFFKCSFHLNIGQYFSKTDYKK